MYFDFSIYSPTHHTYMAIYPCITPLHVFVAAFLLCFPRIEPHYCKFQYFRFICPYPSWLLLLLLLLLMSPPHPAPRAWFCCCLYFILFHIFIGFFPPASCMPSPQLEAWRCLHSLKFFCLCFWLLFFVFYSRLILLLSLFLYAPHFWFALFNLFLYFPFYTYYFWI